jgi:serine/threonine-protein kinase
VDGRSDIYALGVVLYEMVTGRPPFTADTPVAIAYKHVSETAALPSEIEPRVPRDLEAIIMHAMAKQPPARYATAQDLHDDLERFMRGLPVLAPPPYSGDPGAQTIAIPVNPTQLLSASAPPVAPTELEERVPPPGAVGGHPEYPKRRYVPWVIAALLLAAALAAGVYFGGRSLGYFGAPASVYPRYVVNKPYLKAESLLRAQDLVPTVKFQTSTVVAKWLVINQVPGTDVLVKQGDAVALTVSSGPLPPKKILLKYEVGYSLAQVKGQLIPLGFIVHVVYKLPPSPAIPPGYVFLQSPPSGEYPIGTTVRLTVALAQNVKIPSKGVVGQSIGYAHEALKLAGFSVELGNPEFSPTVPDGEVMNTDPPPGQLVQAGSTVYLIVSQGPAVTVPDVVHDTMHSAIAAIDAAHLRPSIVPVDTPGYLPGYVTDQSPAPGSQVKRDTPVVIYVEENSSTTTSSTTTTSTTTPPISGISGIAP